VSTILHLAETLCLLFNQAAKQAGSIKRRRKLSGSSFVSPLVFGWLANPNATLRQLCQTPAIYEVDSSPQALDERFTEQAAACLKLVLDHAMHLLVTADQPASLELLSRFNGVYLLDTTITLPAQLSNTWRGWGSGQPNKGQAAPKLAVAFDFASGSLL